MYNTPVNMNRLSGCPEGQLLYNFKHKYVTVKNSCCLQYIMKCMYYYSINTDTIIN
jgi:hypothetical protein